MSLPDCRHTRLDRLCPRKTLSESLGSAVLWLMHSSLKMPASMKNMASKIWPRCRPNFFPGRNAGDSGNLIRGLQLAVTAGPEIINARVSGSEMIMIAGYMNTMPYSIVTDKNIVKFEQLKGTKTAISRFGSTSELAVRVCPGEKRTGAGQRRDHRAAR